MSMTCFSAIPHLRPQLPLFLTLHVLINAQLEEIVDDTFTGTRSMNSD